MATRQERAVVLLAYLMCLGVAAGGAVAQERDWPQWRGPDRNGQTGAFGSPAVWPPQLEKVWRVEVGDGHSGPVIAGDRVYLHVRAGEGETVESRRLEDGSLVWAGTYPTSYPVKPEASEHGAGPFSTPLLADGVLYTFGIAEVLTAWRAADGEVLWRRDFGQEFREPWAYYGTSLSPLFAGGHVIVHAGGPGDGALVALDPATGEERWRLRGEGPPYGSAIALEIDGVPQLVSFTQNRLIGVDLATGRLLWSQPHAVQWDNTVQTPVAAAGLIIMAAWETPARGYAVRRVGDRWTVDIRWEAPQTAVAYSSPVVIDGQVWGFSHHASGQLYRLDPRTGHVGWRGPPRQGDHASLVAAGRDLLVFTDAGRLVVWRTTGERPKKLSEYEVTSSAQWAHPALVGRRILVKGRGELILWQIPAEAPGGGR